MSDFLTPEQVETWATRTEDKSALGIHHLAAATLREYATIVDALAQTDPLDEHGYCRQCHRVWDGMHYDDCLWLRARKVRGYE